MREKFLDRLRKARLHRGLSQQELSLDSDVDTSAISKMENGERLPSVERLARLSTALNVSTDYLLGLSPHMARCELMNEHEARYAMLPGYKRKLVREMISALLNERVER